MLAEVLRVNREPKLVVGLIGLGRRWVSRSRSQFKVWWASVGEETHKTPNDPKLSDGGAWRGACPTVERTTNAQM